MSKKNDSLGGSPMAWAVAMGLLGGCRNAGERVPPAFAIEPGVFLRVLQTLAAPIGINGAGSFSGFTHAARGLRPAFRAALTLLVLTCLSSSLLFVSVPPFACAASSINVPLDNWAYGALEKLAGFGLLISDLKGTKPYTRMETARLVLEALNAKEKKPKTYRLPELAEYFLQRFQKEYKDELAQLGWGEGPATRTFFEPLHEAKATYVYSDGKPEYAVNFGKGNGQFPKTPYSIVSWGGTPLVHNNEGIVYGEGSNLALQFSSSFKWLDVFSGYVEPIFLVRENGRDGLNLDALSQHAVSGTLGSLSGTDVSLQKGYGKLSPWNVELEVGRDSLWWGPGYHGSLIMSNNAAPLDMIKISNPQATLLPWIFRYLGPFKYTVFCAQLEDDFIPSSPLLSGGRVTFKPRPWLELGASTTFLFNGEGIPGISAGEYFKHLFAFGAFGQSDTIDQLGAFDVRITLPFLWNAQIYLEYGGEDSGGSEYPEEYFGLGDIAYLTGIYFPKITPDGKTDFRFEFAKTAIRMDSTPGIWYGHGYYRSGYTHDQMIMGHFIGPDALDYFARVSRYLRNDLVVGLDYDHIERGLTLSRHVETTDAMAVDATYDLSARWSITVRYAFDSVSNYNMVKGQDQDNHLVMTTLKFHF